MIKDWEKEFETFFIWSKPMEKPTAFTITDKIKLKSFISNLLAQKDKDCQEYKDYYDRRKERSAKIAEENFSEGERSMARAVLRRIENKMSLGHIKLLCQAVADKLNQLKEK